MRWIIPIILIILIGCQDIELIESNNTHPVIRDPPEGRPEIPRTNPPSNMEDDFIPEPEPPIDRKPIPIPVGPAGVDLDVPLGDAIGEHHRVLTQREFKLLRHSPIRVHNNLLVGYDETIRFDFGANSTGRVIFGEDDDGIGTFLLFEEGKPILEYTLQLKQGTFEHYSGREIQVLGHTYVIAEANNWSVALHGRSAAINLFFENDSALIVNSTRRSDTLVSVTPRSISFVIFADGNDDGDILLSPDERLSDNMHKLTFGTDLMDIRYKGAPQIGAARVELQQGDDGYDLYADTKLGLLELDLVTLINGQLVLGDEEDGFRMPPCGYCIAPGDRFTVNTPLGSHVLRYTALNDDSETIVIRDLNNTRHIFEYRGTPGVNASTDLIVAGHRIPVRIGPRDNATGEYNLSIQTNYRSNDILLANDAILRIGTLNGTVLPLQIVVPATKTVDRREQVTHLNITYDGSLQVVAGNLTFYRDDEDTVGMTSYGTLIHLKRYDRRLPNNIGDDAIILIPSEPLYGVVMVED